jgi:hypothetical protein
LQVLLGNFDPVNDAGGMEWNGPAYPQRITGIVLVPLRATPITSFLTSMRY